MTNIYFTKGTAQTMGGWWFDIPKELQSTLDYTIDMLADDEDDVVLAAQAADISMCDEKYSDHLNLRVGGSVYYIYKREGQWRVGADGENSSPATIANQIKILQHFEERSIA